MCIFSLSLLEGDWGEYKIIVHYYFSARSAFFPHPSIPHHTSTPAYTGTCTLTPCDAHGLRELARHSLHTRIHCSPASKPLGVQSRSGCLFRVHGLFMSHRKSVRLSHNSPSVSVTHPNPPGVFFPGLSRASRVYASAANAPEVLESRAARGLRCLARP